MTNEPTELERAIVVFEDEYHHSVTGHHGICIIPTSTSKQILYAAKELAPLKVKLVEVENECERLRKILYKTTPICSVCNWTNVGCINLGEPNQVQVWICHGCIKRERNSLKSKLDEWSNRELLGETERCKFDSALKENELLSKALSEAAKALYAIMNDHSCRDVNDYGKVYQYSFQVNSIIHKSIANVINNPTIKALLEKEKV